MDSFGKRLALARKHAKLNQSELARKVPPLKAQAIQYLENPKSKATGSRHTNSLARACEVNPHWLATGEGTMIPDLGGVQQPLATYAPISDDAMQVAIAWSKLSAERQLFFRELVFMQAALERRKPWQWRGRPNSETYAAWEKRQDENFATVVALEAARQLKKP